MKYIAVVLTIAVMIAAIIVPHYALGYTGTLRENYINGDNADNASPLNTTAYVGQSFTPAVSHNIKQVGLYIQNLNGTATGNVTISVRATAGGVFTGSNLVADSFDIGLIPSTMGWYYFEFTSYAALTSSTMYAIRIERVAGGTGFLNVGYDITSPSYSGGTGINGSNQVSGVDYLFKEYGDDYNVPTVSTGTSSDVTNNQAILRADITSMGSYAFLEYGIEIGRSTSYGTGRYRSSIPATETGSYRLRIAGLEPDTEYHYRAYVYADSTYWYGSDDTVTTSANGAGTSGGNDGGWTGDFTGWANDHGFASQGGHWLLTIILMIIALFAPRIATKQDWWWKAGLVLSFCVLAAAIATQFLDIWLVLLLGVLVLGIIGWKVSHAIGGSG